MISRSPTDILTEIVIKVLWAHQWFRIALLIIFVLFWGVKIFSYIGFDTLINIALVLFMVYSIYNSIMEDNNEVLKSDDLILTETESETQTETEPMPDAKIIHDIFTTTETDSVTEEKSDEEIHHGITHACAFNIYKHVLKNAYPDSYIELYDKYKLEQDTLFDKKENTYELNSLLEIIDEKMKKIRDDIKQQNDESVETLTEEYDPNMHHDGEVYCIKFASDKVGDMKSVSQIEIKPLDISEVNNE